MGFTPNVFSTGDEATQTTKETVDSPESSLDILLGEEILEKPEVVRKNDFATPWALVDNGSEVSHHQTWTRRLTTKYRRSLTWRIRFNRRPFLSKMTFVSDYLRHVAHQVRYSSEAILAAGASIDPTRTPKIHRGDQPETSAH